MRRHRGAEGIRVSYWLTDVQGPSRIRIAPLPTRPGTHRPETSGWSWAAAETATAIAAETMQERVRDVASTLIL